ncbi:HpcH/HpaI aldolase family protein [Paenibacillus koleovorans]|uniref:HpcH/HpaI aldolase family protein n=1 Tax=Paenibacillus koleovorans TaxID=121608 RepID=UPI0013E3D1A7|nr:aldolase/citrate lyase family protein [Paenibacillus koleovorans]
MKGKQVKESLVRGDRIYGTHMVSLGNPLSAGWTADLELDFVFICTEHIPIDRTEVAAMCQLYASRGISPMVRIPYPDKYWANMAIEGGAEGIVAPYVETVEQVRDLVGAVKYRPIKGKFLQDLLSGARQPGDKLARYMERFNQDLYVIVGIESEEAIANLEALLSVDGVDGVFLGPHDITCSMGIPEEYDHPDFIAVIVDVVKRCRAMNKGVGIHMDLTHDRCKPFFDAGMNFMLNQADTVKMIHTLKGDFKQLRDKYGDRYQLPGETAEQGKTIVY